MTIEMQLREYDILIDIITGEVILENLPKDFTMGFVRSDIRANRLNIKLESNSKPYIIGDNNVKMAFRKYDKNIVVMERDVNELYVVDNIIQCTLMPEILSIINRQVLAEIIITDSEGRHLTSARFSFYVREGILDNKNIKQLSNYNILTDMQNQVENLLIDIEENILPAEEERKQAEIDRANVFEEIINSINKAGGDLNNSINLAETINNTILNVEDGTIKQATNINVELEETIMDANIIKTNLKDSTEIAEVIKEDLDDSIDLACYINSTLSNETDGTIKKAMDSKVELENKISNVNILRTEIEDAIADNQIVKKTEFNSKINDLEGVRIHKGVEQPKDTLFWYDAVDNEGIIRK